MTLTDTDKAELAKALDCLPAEVETIMAKRREMEDYMTERREREDHPFKRTMRTA